METFAPGAGGQDDEGATLGQGTVPSKPVIPGFVPVRELGSGGSATVWLATERGSGKRFAVKCLSRRTDLADLGEAKSSMRREVHLLSRLDHEHLVQLRGVVPLAGPFDGGLGLIMDYAPGGSLGQLVSSRGRLSVGETVTILTPLAQALAYLHHQGMTHSDVSPGNVLFTAQGKPLLADLGVSRIVGDTSGVPDCITSGFADPGPVAGGAAELRPERDTYALAALAWYCLTGSAPDSAARRPPLTLLVPGVPAALAVAIEAGLHPDGQQRPSAAELGVAVYRSAAPDAVDLSGSVHATVVPELLTRRRASVPRPKRDRVRAIFGRIRSPFGRISSPRRRGGTGRRSAPRVSRRRRVAAIALALGTLGVAGSATTVWWAGDRGPVAGQHTQGPTSAPKQAEPKPGEPKPGEPKPGGPSQSGPGLEDVAAEVLDQIRSESPQEAIRGLSTLRDAAFRTGKLELLDHVNAQGSDAAVSDGKVRAELKGAGLVLAGFSTTLTSVNVEGAPRPESATVAVRLETSAYEERDASGQVLRVRPAGKPQELRVVLLRGGGAWKIAEILNKEA